MAEKIERLSLEVATPSGLALEAQCESVQAPSVRGEFGVLPEHLPLLAALKFGLLKYRVDGRDHVAAVGPGFVEAEPDRVLLLTEAFAGPDGVDADEVRRELDDAEKRLSASDPEEQPNEYNEAQRDVDWALARLEMLDVATK